MILSDSYACVLSHFSRGGLFATPWATARQTPLSIWKHGQRGEYWSGLPFPPPGDVPNSGIEAEAPMSPVLAGRFFTTGAKVLSKQPDKQKCSNQENRAPLTRQTAPTALGKEAGAARRPHGSPSHASRPHTLLRLILSTVSLPSTQLLAVKSSLERRRPLQMYTHTPHPTGSHITPLSAPLPLLRSLP